MRIFEKLTPDQRRKLNKDTSQFFIGAPEAEAESTFNSKMHLVKAFEDFLEIMPKLNSEKFIITGRKGSGKSAIAEHIYYNASNDATTFCDFIKKSDIDLEKIAQISTKDDLKISQELLIEWIILTKLVKQLISNEALSNQKEIKDLKTFLKKNSGFVEINANQIHEIIQQKGWEINVEYFKRYLSSRFGNRYDIRSGKAPFHLLIPHLKDTVRDLFLNTENRENDYVLIFDDLDIGFNTNNQTSSETLLNILRIVRNYNITFFGKENISAKIIVLLRDDLSRFLLTKDADTSKLFSSYEIPLKWYEHQDIHRDENSLKIKQFINKRIAINFEDNGFEFNKVDPWKSLVQDEQYYSLSSFKYVIDHTLIRPRDLILFFKPLPDLKFRLPLTKNELNILLGKYAIEFVNELKNELAAHYSTEDISAIFNSLKTCIYNSSGSNIKYQDFKDQLEVNRFSQNSKELLELLFDQSIVGNQIDSTKVIFKHWEKDDELYRCDLKRKIVPHFTIRNYFANKSKQNTW